MKSDTTLTHPRVKTTASTSGARRLWYRLDQAVVTVQVRTQFHALHTLLWLDFRLCGNDEYHHGHDGVKK